MPLAFVRAPDGTLSAMHDTVRGETIVESGQFRYEVPVFNPSIEVTRESRLRLINPGDAAATVTIGGIDDSGSESIGGEVALTLVAGGAKTLTSRQLEAGDTDFTGRLGAGTGTWRLTVSSDQPLQVVNIAASTTGYWNNLSTTAIPGEAPADQAGLNERFVGNSVTYQSSSGHFTHEAQDNDRFAETTQADGFTVTYTGTYGYTAIGPDAGRLTLDYDDDDACQSNLYFSNRTSGWFASHCTSLDNPDGDWTGGIWFVEVEDDEGQDGVGDIVETTFGVNDALPGVPTSGNFVPASTGGGSQVTATADGTTIALDNGGYFELDDGTRYTCVAADGCMIVNGTVTAGTVDGRAAGSGEVDRFPTFRTAARPGEQTYTAGTAIDTLTLPEAIGGNGTLTYALSPRVPGLMFNASMRQVTGTPSTAGTYVLTYTVADEDGDTDALSFTVTVSPDPNDATDDGSGDSAPPALQARGSSSKVALDWSAAVLGGDAELTGYTLHRGDGDACDNLAVLQAGLAADLLYAEDGTVSTDATYCYRLTATGSTDENLESNDAVVRAVTAAMPTDLQVTSTSTSMIGLSWTAPPDDGGGEPYGYNVYRCEGADCEFEGESWLAWVTDGTAYTDDGSGSRPLIAQAAYRYAVATSRAGEVSLWSNWVTASATEDGSEGESTVSTAPPRLVARGSSFRVALDWRAPILANDVQLTGYTLYRGGGDTCANLAVIQDGLAPDLLYTEDNSVSTGATYCYRLTATDSANESLASNDEVVLAVAPEMPTDLRVTASTASSISLTWTAPPDDGGGPPYGFNVYRCQGADCQFEGETWLAWVTDGTTYTDDGSGSRPLIAQATYRYAVGTSRAGEISVWSNWVAATATDSGNSTGLVPSFPSGAGPGNQTYTLDTAIGTLALPEASGGDGTLTYSLSPNVPGLAFEAATRTLSGSPSTTGTYNMSYTATDEDRDTATLRFVISVTASGGDDGNGPVSDGNDGQVHTWRGVDLSYVNEMEDCGAVYRLNGAIRDPYELFAEIGANLARLRLWHTPDWTAYSTLSDVTSSIRRAKAQGLAVLLDFHYSDDWADPTQQVVPAAWRDIGTTQGLARALYDYTYNVLSTLDSLGLAPEYVQVGNEINTAILQPDEASSATIHWTRQAALLNAGIRAVRDFGAQSDTTPRIMLHVAGPENVGWFFDAATAAGVNDFDIIGFSYYPRWSNVSLTHIDETVAWMRNRYGKDIVVAETAYPWTLAGNDSASNLGGQDWLIEGYPASTDGQRRYNIDLMQATLDGGGLGTVYWEPAWISTRCSTRWGQGSHWENQTFFDYENSQLHEGADYLSRDYQ